jgi:hypothetical protein
MQTVISRSIAWVALGACIGLAACGAEGFDETEPDIGQVEQAIVCPDGCHEAAPEPPPPPPDDDCDPDTAPNVRRK